MSRSFSCNSRNPHRHAGGKARTGCWRWRATLTSTRPRRNPRWAMRGSSSPHGLHFEEGAPLRGGAEASVASRSGTAKRSMEMPPSCASFPENNGSDSFCIRMVDLPRQTRPSTGCFSADSGSCVLLSQACFARSKQHGQIPKAAPDRISFSEAFLPKCVTHAVRRKCNPCGEHMPGRRRFTHGG